MLLAKLGRLPMAADKPSNDGTQSFVALTSGTLVSHYKIIEKIGAGGMGEVYLAQDTKLNRKVALKFLPSYLCQDEECRKRFTREAQAAAGLDHPNIAAIYEVGEYNGRPFYSMQVIEGQSLKDIIAGKDLPIDRILEIAIQVCEGLQAAHEKGIIHRDIKPSNILLDSHGRVRIVDFGLASIRGSETLTKSGSTLGTIGYMSPEQVQAKEVDHRSDLFSLGVVLYELITKQSPFKRDTEAATLKAVIDDVVEPLARYKRDVPELLESIIEKLLEKNPEHRYQSAAGAVSDLKRLKQDSGSKLAIMPDSKTTTNLLYIALPVFVVILAFTILFWKPWKFYSSTSQKTMPGENRLAILYFENLNDPDDSLRMGDIVTNLLITDLSESKYTNVVSSQRLYDILKQLGHEGERHVDRSIATQVAKTAQARWMLLGSILNTDPDIVIASQIVEIATGDAIASQKIEGQPGERIFSVVDKLTNAVKEDLSLPDAADQETDPRVAKMTTDSPEAYRLYLEGQELFYQHIWSDAEVDFLKAIKIDSTFAMAHYYLAAMDYWRNDPQAKIHIENALRYIDRATQKQKYYINDLDARLNRDIPRAISNLEKIIELYPEDKDAYVSLGLIKKYETHDLKGAAANFEEAVELDPYHREALNQLAYAYSDLGHFEKAIWAINKYIEVAPDEANAYDSRGEILAMNGKLDEAITSYEKANQLEPGFSRFRLADLYMYRGDFAKADSLFRAIASDAREITRANGRLALTKMPRYQGKFSEALRLLEVGIATDRMELGECFEIAEKIWARVMINKFLGKDQTVIDDLRQAIAIVEEHEARDLYTGLYRAYLVAELVKNGEQSAADSLMSDIISTIEISGYPDSSFYWMASGYTHFKLQQYDSAAAFWEKVIAPAPNHFPGLMYLGTSYLNAGKLGKAVSTLEKASNIYDVTRAGTPDMGVICYYQLGRAYEASGWTERAIDLYEKFLEIWKNADPGIKEIDDARERLKRLRGSS
jgi:serine/threonine protein kinase/Flp pilus assembly protein TadD